MSPGNYPQGTITSRESWDETTNFAGYRRRIFVGRVWRGHSGAGVARQLHAITASGDRTNALQAVSVPTTVIHGESDVLVRPAGGRATADAVPGARLRMIEGMGHDLPPQLWPTFVEEIVANAERAREGDPAPAS